MSLTADDLMTYWTGIMGTVRKMLPQADPMVWEDLAADAMEKALHNLDSYEDRGLKPFSWLASIAVRCALDYVRRDRHRSHLPLTDTARATIDAGGHAHIEQMDVQAAIERMTPEMAEWTRIRLRGFGSVLAGREMGMGKTSAWRREHAMHRALEFAR